MIRTFSSDIKTGCSEEIPIVERAVQPEKAPFPIFCSRSGMLTDVSASHEANALSPSSVRFFGSVIYRRLRHSAKASGPIYWSESGRETVEREEQDWKVE